MIEWAIFLSFFVFRNGIELCGFCDCFGFFERFCRRLMGVFFIFSFLFSFLLLFVMLGGKGFFFFFTILGGGKEGRD